jgi:hypothetical protein
VAFKVFTAYGAGSRLEATLRANGYLFLSHGILKRAGYEDAIAAQLMYDEDSDRLGVKLFHNGQPRIADPTIRDMSKERSGKSVNILPLIRFYNLPDPKKVGRQVFPVTFEDGLVVIDLKSLRNAKELPAGQTAEQEKETEDSAFDDDIPF